MPTSEFAARIKALKGAPASEIVVAAIAGPSTPYQVHWKSPSTADTSCGQTLCPWPEITHSCVAADSSFADPGIRINQWVSAFGSNGIESSICDASFGPALQQVATRIGALLTAGGGSGGGPAPIPTCTTGVAGSSGGGASGTAGTTGTTGAGGSNTGLGAAPGADASVDRHGPVTGEDCQVGGAGTNAGGVAFALVALLARRRRRP